MTSAGPIYITGLDRSGKTTMRAFLASHSRIAIPAVGSNLFMYFHEQYGDLSDSANLDRCLDAMLRYKHVAFLEPDETAIRQEFDRGPHTYARLFEIFLAQFARREGKPRWGAQSGLEEQYAEVMFSEYPGLKVIQMVRDPRDRYAASLEKWPGGRGRAGGAAARWAYSVDHAERNLRRHPEDYVVVRFEDLVTDPRSELERVCSFLGETFEGDMLEMPAADRHRRMLSEGSSGPGLLSTDHIGIHRGAVPAAEIAFLEHALGSRMRQWGYGDPIRRDRSIWWYLRVVPDQRARMLAWRSVEELHRRAPHRFGRRFGDRMLVERVG